jgi:hypothetical protein
MGTSLAISVELQVQVSELWHLDCGVWNAYSEFVKESRFRPCKESTVMPRTTGQLVWLGPM